MKPHIRRVLVPWFGECYTNVHVWMCSLGPNGVAGVIGWDHFSPVQAYKNWKRKST